MRRLILIIAIVLILLVSLVSAALARTRGDTWGSGRGEAHTWAFGDTWG